MVFVSFSFSLKVESFEILRNAKLLKINNPISIQSIDPNYLGGSVGNWYLYNLTGTAYGNGTSKDSIFLLNYFSLPNCPSENPLVALRKEYIVSDSFPNGRTDTTFLYVRSDSSVDYGGIIVYRIGYNNWEGVDTCIIGFNTPIAIPSFDDDSIPDTLYLRPSPANLISKTADTVYSKVQLKYKIKNTGTIQGFQVDSITSEDVYKFRLKEYFGFLQIKLDTSYVKIYFAQGTFPLNRADVLTKNLAQAVYIPQFSDNKFKMIGNKIVFDNPYKGYIEIYKADGTLYRRFYFNGYDLDLSRYKGLYIIRIGKDRIKFIN